MFPGIAGPTHMLGIVLEVLLDIRELLQKPNEEKKEIK